MLVMVIKVFLILCAVLLLLYVGVILLGYFVYRKERKMSAKWGVAMFARLGSVAEQVKLIVDGLEKDNMTGRQAELLREIIVLEHLPEKIHEYLVIIKNPWMCGAADRLKAEIEKHMKRLEELTQELSREEPKS